MHKIKILDDNFLINELLKLPNSAISLSVANGNMPGEIWINNSKNFVFIKTNGVYATIAGEIGNDEIDDLFELLYSYKTITLVVPIKYHHHFIQNNFFTRPRVELLYQNKEVILPPLVDKYKIKPIDNVSLLKQATWYEFVLELYGDSKNFFKNGFGITLCQENEIICEVYGMFIANKICEIGIVTNEKYRGQGFAIIATKYFIKECLNRNLIPNWSCNLNDLGSLKTALKADFCISQYYTFLDKI